MNRLIDALAYVFAGATLAVALCFWIVIAGGGDHLKSYLRQCSAPSQHAAKTTKFAGGL